MQGMRPQQRGIEGAHKGCMGRLGPHIVLLEQGDGQVLQNVMLDTCSILGADPVLGGGPDKALSAVLILHPAGVPSQVAVDVAQMHQYVTVVALQSTCRCSLSAHNPGQPVAVAFVIRHKCGQF